MCAPPEQVSVLIEREDFEEYRTLTVMFTFAGTITTSFAPDWSNRSFDGEELEAFASALEAGGSATLIVSRLQDAEASISLQGGTCTFDLDSDTGRMEMSVGGARIVAPTLLCKASLTSLVESARWALSAPTDQV